MNEAETRAELIDPTLKVAGWGVIDKSSIRRELITKGRLQGGGRRDDRDIADYVLVYRNQKLAVIEAKADTKAVTEGLSQAKKYAEKLQTRFAFSTNGKGIYRVDMETGEEGDVEDYPSPDEMWNSIYGGRAEQESFWREQFSKVPFNNKGGQWEERYYQHNAITKTLEAIVAGKDRILLTLATGTGKTGIAFQIAWKLFQTSWNIKNWRQGFEEREKYPTRLPRILFLADRNILANQAFNDFSSFPDDALVRIKPDSIRKRQSVPTNGNVFFTIFQTFMTGKDEDGNPKPSFGQYPPDFFDLIVIDECHRGGANDESSWRGIMEYFSSAVQLGLTATPKRDNNIDTYEYFGEPVYTYSLKEGINDGFLTPFKVRQYATTIDEYVYEPDDEVIEGEVEQGRKYQEDEFNKSIEIKEREKVRVELFMNETDPYHKTIVFCANQKHALLVRDLINQIKTVEDVNYCVRVTADEGDMGDEHLANFRDNEKTVPTVLTTSRKLTTGVDARNVRNIVLMRSVKTVIEFKQIVGRGTRLFEGKDYFTIYDFVKAYEHFNDPEWDGEPEERVEITNGRSQGGDENNNEEGEVTVNDSGPPETGKMVKVKLADGKEREIRHIAVTSFYNNDGRTVSSAEFVKSLFGELPELFKDEEQLREIWSGPETRGKLLKELSDRGYGKDILRELARIVNAEKSDIYDVLAYIGFNISPETRQERVDMRKGLILSNRKDKEKEFLEFVLGQYIEQGVGELDIEKLSFLLELKYGHTGDAQKELGKPAADIRDIFVGFQKSLYEPAKN